MIGRVLSTLWFVVWRVQYVALMVALIVVGYVVLFGGWREALTFLARHFLHIDAVPRGKVAVSVVEWKRQDFLGGRAAVDVPVVVVAAIRDVVVYTPSAARWTEEALKATTVTITLKRDDVARVAAFGVDIDSAVIDYVTYDHSFQWTNVQRIMAAIQKGRKLRLETKRRQSQLSDRDADLLGGIEAAYVSDKKGALVVKAFKDLKTAKAKYARANVLYAAVLFVKRKPTVVTTDAEATTSSSSSSSNKPRPPPGGDKRNALLSPRRGSGGPQQQQQQQQQRQQQHGGVVGGGAVRASWEAVAEYGSWSAVARIKECVAGDDGGNWLTREVVWYAALEVARPLFRFESVLIHQVRMAVRYRDEGTGETTRLAPTDATCGDVQIDPSVLRSTVSFVVWVQHLVAKLVASTGFDVVKDGFGAGVTAAKEGIDRVTSGLDMVASAVGGPAEVLVQGSTAAARDLLGGALDGGRLVVGGLTDGGKAAVTTFSRAAHEGDAAAAAGGVVKTGHAIVGSILEGAETLAAGTERSVGSLLEGVANGAEYAPVVGSVAAGSIRVARTVLGGVYGGTTAVLGGVARGLGAVVQGAADGDLTNSLARGSDHVVKGVDDGAQALEDNLTKTIGHLNTGATRTHAQLAPAFSSLEAAANHVNAEAAGFVNSAAASSEDFLNYASDFVGLGYDPNHYHQPSHVDF